ncbi:MAG TPA: malate synthase A [Anaeromyxobacteraceae bacterium]|nr:malate synthase A [Anaeromyxobacteraceae bacterium]
MPANTPANPRRAPEYADVLTPEAREFLAGLVRRFGWRLDKLLERRREQQRRFDAGERPRFLPETAYIRAGDWTVAPIPADLQDRRVEITGPVDRKMVINALNSGANVFMADFEDSNSPTRDNVLSGQQNLRDAIRRTITYAAPETGKTYRLADRTAVLMVRPRGLHLVERHFEVDGEPVPASLFDFGLWFFHNAKELVRRGTGPYLYLPKLEHYEEARWWNDVFVHAQEKVGLPRGTIRATVLVETISAAFQMHEILFELREHSAGLNCGRWDYIFSFIKKFRNDPKVVLPDRSQVTMDKGFLRAYVQLLIQTCHRRNVHAMGGMAAQIPIKDDPAASEAALAKVRADKLREVKDGHDGTWVAHPGLVPVAKAIFDEHMKTPNQIDRKREDVKVAEADLLAPAEGTRTEAGLRHNVRVAVQYLEAWLRGTGCVPIYNLMEDAATVEISRAQVWQWLRHGMALDNGKHVTRELFVQLVDEEMERIQKEVGAEQFAAGRFPEARDLYVKGSTSKEFDEFLTIPAYAILDRDEPAGNVAELVVARPASPWPAHPDPLRWEGVKRNYDAGEVERLRGSVRIEHTLARLGTERLWELLHSRPYVHALGALSGQQAVQMVKAGLEAIYLSGWQVAADANTAGQTYPDQSLYPADSVPAVVRRINRAFQRADQIATGEGKGGTHWFAPIVADAEAGFGGPLNAFELMKAMIEAGAAAVHFEDQVASEKKCGHLGGKVLVPTSQFVRTLNAARLAADVMGVPTILVARTDADSAKLIMSDVDPYDAPWIEKAKGRTPEGFHHLKSGVKTAIARGLAYAPYADLIWCETSTPDLREAKEFAEGIRSKFPGKMLAYNCSPSFNWKKNLDDATIAKFQRELGAMGYKFQFVTLAGFHALNYSMFQLASEYRLRGMQAYTELQVAEFGAESRGYTATRHQAEVGTGYFDQVNEVLSAGQASTLALVESTEAAQFQPSDTVQRAQRLLDEDHAKLHEIGRRIRQSKEMPTLVRALEDLNATLVEHFAREEHPQGLFAILGTKAPVERQKFAEILAEHESILANVRELLDQAREGKGEHAGLAAQAAMLSRILGDHEKRESEVTQAILGPRPVALV